MAILIPNPEALEILNKVVGKNLINYCLKIGDDHRLTVSITYYPDGDELNKLTTFYQAFREQEAK